jgi:hypothetical protein
VDVILVPFQRVEELVHHGDVEREGAHQSSAELVTSDYRAVPPMAPDEIRHIAARQEPPNPFCARQFVAARNVRRGRGGD